MSKHTPTPWANPMGCASSVRGIVTNDEGEEFWIRVAGCRNPELGIETACANAAFIVKACNAHEALALTLKTLMQEIEYNGIERDFDGLTIRKARALLARLEDE